MRSFLVKITKPPEFLSVDRLIFFRLGGKSSAKTQDVQCLNAWTIGERSTATTTGGPPEGRHVALRGRKDVLHIDA
jgi:hypothetical protein